MLDRKLIYSLLISLAILAAILAGIILFTKNKDLHVIFFDVGQGDSALISQGSNQILIDGGKDGRILLGKIGKYVTFWDRNIESIVASHPDQDHIGGLVDVIKTYKVQNVIKTNAQSDSQTYKKLEEEISANNIQKIEAKKGVKIIFPNGAVAEVLYPSDSLPETVDNASNDNSVVIRLTRGEKSFLFTGDLPSTEEPEILSDSDLASQILKVSHHGSKYASGDEFLSAVKPQDAIISVGRNNSYGHPNREVLDRLLRHKMNIIRTDEFGDIEYLCKNGENSCLVVN